MLDMFDVGNEVFSELEDMGWQGQVMYSALSKAYSIGVMMD